MVDDICPGCEASFDDKAVAKMTEEQADLLKNDVCPWCGYKLQ